MKRKTRSQSKRKLTPSEIYSLLSAPLPAEALTQIGNSSLTAINDAYVRERLNQVLGPDGWEMKPEPLIRSCKLWMNPETRKIFTNADGHPYWETTATVSVWIAALRKTFYGEGGFRSTDRGDSRKGAITDAFGKALSDLIGIEVYKNQVNTFDLLTPEAFKSYRLGFECGFVSGKNGLTLEQAMDSDEVLTPRGKAKAAETS